MKDKFLQSEVENEKVTYLRDEIINHEVVDHARRCAYILREKNRKKSKVYERSSLQLIDLE